jgi:hypothetical protein
MNTTSFIVRCCFTRIKKKSRFKVVAVARLLRVPPDVSFSSIGTYHGRNRRCVLFSCSRVRRPIRKRSRASLILRTPMRFTRTERIYVPGTGALRWLCCLGNVKTQEIFQLWWSYVISSPTASSELRTIPRAVRDKSVRNLVSEISKKWRFVAIIKTLMCRCFKKQLVHS